MLAVTVLTHASYINNGFTWLDHGDIERGRAVVPIGELGKAFVSRFGQTGFYRPLVTVANSLDTAIYGKNAAGYHATNLLWHVVVTVAVMTFWRQYLGWTEKKTAVVGLIFGLHPLSFLPVGAISYRPELLATALTFAALYWHGRVRQSGRVGDGLAAVLLAGGAMLAKESALVWLVGGWVWWEATRGKNLKNGKIVWWGRGRGSVFICGVEIIDCWWRSIEWGRVVHSSCGIGEASRPVG